jgi:hypothetical protein
MHGNDMRILASGEGQWDEDLSKLQVNNPMRRVSRPGAEDLKAISSVGCVCKRLKREESGELELSTGCHARARSCDADVTTS